MITIVDYGMGNLGSIMNMLKKIGFPARLSSSPEEVGNADKLILPGVGSFDAGMRNLVDRGLVAPLAEKVVDRGTPILGICLGMQLMAGKSEEGTLPGLGWLDADVVRFRPPPESERLKVPHMGWNTLEPRKDCPLFRGAGPELRYYFVHSYHVVCRDPSDWAATTCYGADFVSAFQHGSLYGVQFHPEKSHRFGMALLRNFAELA
jgi:glutamine amidotransferase